MEERTPASVREVLRLLPPSPRAIMEYSDGVPRFVVREREEDDKDVVRLALRNRIGDHDDASSGLYSDILFFERPSSDTVYEAWMAAPLVFHDKRLVAVADELIIQPRYLAGTPHDFTKLITTILGRHPGPVAFFSIDSSAFPAPDLLAEWLENLSEKRVESLTLVNISRTQELEFPLHQLRGDGILRCLTLGFFDLTGGLRSAEDVCVTFGSLGTLMLAGCTFDGEDLASVIVNCSVLTTLCIWGSDLTAGCRARELTMSSHLRILELLQCRATALIFIMPKLNILTLDVSPAKDAKKPWVGIHLASCDALLEIKLLLLDRQLLSFDSIGHVRLNRKITTTIPHIKRLSVGLNMSSQEQNCVLTWLLHRMPILSHLNIHRTDSPSDTEGVPWTADGSLSCGCLDNSLNCLLVNDYRGGMAEMAFIKAMLRSGKKLTEVTVSPHLTLPMARRRADSQVLKNSLPISKSCKVNFLGCD